MRIIYLSESVLPSTYANSVHVMKMCHALGGLGHEVTLFALKGKGQGSPFGYYGVSENFEIQYCYKPKVKFGSMLLALNARSHFKKRNDVELLYARHSPSLLALVNLGIGMIYEAHMFPFGRIERTMQALIFRQPNFLRLIVISDRLRKDYLRIFPDLQGRIEVAHDASDGSRFITGPPEETVEKERSQIGYVGALYKGRGVEIIVQLAADLVDMDFHIVGGRPAEVESWKTRTMKLKNLTFHGFVPNGDLFRFYSNFDLVLAPYQMVIHVAEGANIGRWLSPMKIFEYMSHGIPIICSDVPVLREVMKHRSNALMVNPPHNVEAWKNCILEMLRNPKLRIRLSRRGYDDWKNNHTWKKRAQQIIEASCG